MSSTAATQSDGYYIPPEYLESGEYKKKSLNEFAGSKGHNQYLQKGVVRFELPYDGFCTRCNAHVGKGTRFNAKKSEVGAYYTTKIWEFDMTCRICARTHFLIRTNPKERSFDYVEGIRKQVQEFDTIQAGTAGVIDTDFGNGIVPFSGSDAVDESSYGEKRKNETDKLSKLERIAYGERKSMTRRDQLNALLQSNHRLLDDAASNATIRETFRAERKDRKQKLQRAAATGLGRGISLDENSTKEEVQQAREAFLLHHDDKTVRKRDASLLREKEERYAQLLQSGLIFEKRGTSRASKQVSSVDKVRKAFLVGVSNKRPCVKTTTIESPPVIKKRKKTQTSPSLPENTPFAAVHEVSAPSSFASLVAYDSSSD